MSLHQDQTFFWDQRNKISPSKLEKIAREEFKRMLRRSRSSLKKKIENKNVTMKQKAKTVDDLARKLTEA